MKYPKIPFIIVFILGIVFGVYVLNEDRLVMIDDAQAALSPVKAADEREV